MAAGSQSYSVLSRVCFAGLDHTQRSNKFAHHVALTTGEQPNGGPAWLMAQPNMMVAQWSGEPEEYDQGPQIPDGDGPPVVCDAWATATGDAGWAGVLAEAFANNPAKPCFVIYPPGLDMLPLMVEALALIEERERWQVTFNTYFTDLPAGLTCAWRCCVAGSPAAQEARRAGGLVIDLTGQLAAAPDSEFVQVARTGAAAAAVIEDNVYFEPPAMPRFDESEDSDPDPLPVSSQPNSLAAMVAAGAGPIVKPKASLSALRARTTIPLVAGSVDQNWMPPIGATMVEGSDSAESSRGAKWAFWSFAAVWPLVVGSIAIGILRKTLDQSVRSQLTEAKTQFQSEQSNNKSLNEANGSLTGTVNLLTSENVVLKKIKEELEGKLRTANEIVPLTTPATQATATTVPADKPVDSAKDTLLAVTPTITLSPPIPLLQKMSGGTERYFCRLDDVHSPSKGSQSILLCNNIEAQPQDVQLQLIPADYDDLAKFACKIGADGNVLSRTSKGGFNQEQILCKFIFANGKLTLDWPAVTTEDDKLRRSILQTSVLKLHNSTNFQSLVQFIAPETLQFFLVQKDAIDVSLGTGPARRLVLAKVEGPWRVSMERPETNFFQLNYSETETFFTLRLEKNKLTSTWIENQRKETGKQRELTTELANIKKEQDQINNEENGFSQMKPTDVRRDGGLKSSGDRSTKCKKKQQDCEAKLTKQTTICEYFSAVKPFFASVQLNSGAIISNITVRVKGEEP